MYFRKKKKKTGQLLNDPSNNHGKEQGKYELERAAEQGSTTAKAADLRLGRGTNESIVTALHWGHPRLLGRRSFVTEA